MTPPAPPRAPRPPAAAPCAPPGTLRRLFGLRHMLVQLVVRDVAGRYRGSFGGIAWSLITPVLIWWRIRLENRNQRVEALRAETL